MLTAAEKEAGRAFRDACQAALDARNAADQAGMLALAVWRVVRHLCPDADGASVGITLRTVTEFGNVTAADGRFAFISKEGHCSGCGLVVRTPKGRFALL